MGPNSDGRGLGCRAGLEVSRSFPGPEKPRRIRYSVTDGTVDTVCDNESLLGALATPSAATAAELIIGLIPEQNVFRQMKRYQPIADYMREQFGIEICGSRW
jgi:ABC-type phosphate/phosphonate transport system substrate-binding protein